jgi:hypothetical protein
MPHYQPTYHHAPDQRTTPAFEAPAAHPRTSPARAPARTSNSQSRAQSTCVTSTTRKGSGTSSKDSVPTRSLEIRDVYEDDEGEDEAPPPTTAFERNNQATLETPLPATTPTAASKGANQTTLSSQPPPRPLHPPTKQQHRNHPP